MMAIIAYLKTIIVMKIGWMNILRQDLALEIEIEVKRSLHNREREKMFAKNARRTRSLLVTPLAHRLIPKRHPQQII